MTFMELEKLIVETLKAEVVPAVGCTEPVAVALACAKAKELMVFNNIEKAEILVSANIYKNGLSVGIPNTGEVGLYIAGALGLIGGKSEKALQVLEGISLKDVESAKALLKSGKLSLDIKDTEEKVYVEVNLITDAGTSKVVIQKKHNRFVYLESQGRILLDIGAEGGQDGSGNNPLYTMRIRDIISGVEGIPHSEIAFMLEGLEMNEKAAMSGLDKRTGMGVGFSLHENMRMGMLSDDLMSNALMLTAAASDARMSGMSLPVMSSNGSGNNGLTAILPLVAYQRKFPVEDVKMAKAVAISHLINSYIKHYIGRLSALCGCGVAAATGAGVAIAWLMGADEEQVDGVIKNMLASTSGMICDGAKTGCALKLATSVSAAIQSALLAMNGSVVPAKDGIIAETAEETIRNIGTLSADGMNIVDGVLLRMMRQMQPASSGLAS